MIFHLDAIEYRISFLPCHGVDGHGVAPKPAAITTIRKLDDSVFPA